MRAIVWGLMISMSYGITLGILNIWMWYRYTVFGLGIVVLTGLSLEWIGKYKKQSYRLGVITGIILLSWLGIVSIQGQVQSVAMCINQWILSHLEWMQVGLIGVGITVVVYTLVVTLQKGKIISGAGGLLYVGIVVMKVPMGILGIMMWAVATLGLYFYDYYRELGKLGLKQTKEMDISYTKSMGVVMGVLIFLSFILANGIPLEWKVIHSWFDQPQYVGMPYGFPYSGKLGGDLTLDNRLVMEVTGPKPIYLRTKDYSTYQDRQWQALESDEGEVIRYHSGSRIGDTKRSNQGKLERYCMTFRALMTRELPMPTNPLRVDFLQPSGKAYISGDQEVILEKAYGGGFAYEVTVGEYERGSSRIPENLEAYKQVPKSCSPRVEGLTKDIVKNRTTDYDRVQAIATYLQTHYQYTLTPGPIPEGKELVDYFLFEHREGYCTYFATAMAMMVRTIGLPSRYVEGYTMANTYKPDKEIYAITNKQAHAWVEVYFKDIGWMAFEPTATYIGNLEGEKIENPYEEVVSLGNSEMNLSKKHSIMTSKKILYLTFVTLGIITLGMIVYKCCKPRKINYSTRERFVKEYDRSLYLLAKKGLPLAVGQGLKAYSILVDQKLHFSDGEFEKLTEVFLLARYSQHAIDKSDCEALSTYNKMLVRSHNCKNR